MRVAGWESALAGVIEDWRHRPFSWGAADCMAFSNECCKAVTGTECFADWVGTYTSAKSARRMFAKLREGRTFFEGVDERLRRGIGVPGRGDIVAEETRPFGIGVSLGVNIGRANAFVGPEGLEFRQLRMGQVWWEV